MAVVIVIAGHEVSAFTWSGAAVVTGADPVIWSHAN
jgi:hypothetical protein